MVRVPITTAVPAGGLTPRVADDHGGTPPVGSLLTVFTPEPGCFPVTTDTTSDLDIFWSSTTDCAPPGYTSYWQTFYYSPAICPSGFSIGCSRYDDAQGPTVAPTEEAYLCVMSGYECAPDSWTSYATNSDLNYEQVMIQIRWAQSDLTLLETHPLTPGLVPTGPDFADEVTESTSTRSTSNSASSRTVAAAGSSATTDTNLKGGDQTADNASNGTGISSSAQIGIGVGVGLAGLLIAGFIAFLIWQHRKRKLAAKNGTGEKAQMPPPPPGQYPVYQYPYMPGPPVDQNGQPVPGQVPPGYPQPAYANYSSYLDPKSGVTHYYSPVPQPSELSGTAIGGGTSPGTTVGVPISPSPPSSFRHYSGYGPVPIGVSEADSVERAQYNGTPPDPHASSAAYGADTPYMTPSAAAPAAEMPGTQRYDWEQPRSEQASRP